MSDRSEFPDKDRRKHRRAADVFIVTYRLRSPFAVTLEMKEKEYAAVAMDISEGGLGVDTPEELPSGAPVRLKFKMVNDLAASEQNRQRSFELDGESRYCRLVGEKSYRVGVLFKETTPEERVFIANYVRDQSLKKYFG